jgi:hypothetical protein
MWNYTTFKIGLIGIIWKKMELFGIICELFGTTFGIIGIIWNYFWSYWNYLELFVNYLELLLELLELFGITFGITLINLTVIPNGITFEITWNYLENNSIFGITRLFFIWCLAPRLSAQGLLEPCSSQISSHILLFDIF